MNLKMVTYEIDDTQFLVDAKTNEEAVKKAIHANFNMIKAEFPRL